MLQSMRKMAHTWAFKALMTILSLSFVMWGVEGFMNSNPQDQPVAKVGKRVLTSQELNQEFQQTLTYARSLLGRDVDVAQAKKLGLMDTALNNLVQRTALDMEANRLGINVPSQAVYSHLAAQPSFRDKDGKFDKNTLKKFLETTRLSEKDFMEQIQRDQLRDVFANAPAVPELKTRTLATALSQKRIVQIATLKNSSMTVDSADEDKKIQNFYDQNHALFTAPEYRNLTVARLSIDDVAKDINISDADVESEFNSNKDRFNKPERRDLMQVVVQNEEKAKEISDRARTHNDLNTAAKALGYEAVPLPSTEEKGLFAELAKPVFTLKAREISAPIKSSLGWHIIQVKKITPPEDATFKEVRDELRTTMRRNQAIESITKLVNKLDDELAAGHTLEEISDSIKLNLVKIPMIDATGKTVDGKQADNLPTDTSALKTAFGQNGGEASPVMDDRNGNYTIIRTDDVVSSKVRPFDEVKTQVKTLWREQEQATLAQAEAEKLAQSIREGKKLASLSGTKGIEIHTAKPISQAGDNNPEIPSTILPQLFMMKAGDVTTVSEGGRQFIVQISAIEEANASEVLTAQSEASTNLNGRKADELLNMYIQHLGTRYPVLINYDAMQTINPQGG